MDAVFPDGLPSPHERLDCDHAKASAGKTTRRYIDLLEEEVLRLRQELALREMSEISELYREAA